VFLNFSGVKAVSRSSEQTSPYGPMETNPTYLGESQVEHSLRSQVLQTVFSREGKRLQQDRQRDGMAWRPPVELCHRQQHA